MLEERYEKSEAGRAEIKLRALVQARIARNLLLVIDRSKTGGQWVGVVQGAAPADLELLLQHGLITPAAGVAVSRPMPLGGPVTQPAPLAPASVPVPAPVSVPSAAPVSIPAAARQTVQPGATRPAGIGSSRMVGAPVSNLDFQQLYTVLTAFAKQQGLLKGYRMALEVEQCADFEQLQSLALDVVDRVRATKGDAAAHALRETLGFS